MSTNSQDAQANGRSFSHVFSPDGTKIAFTSEANNLVNDDTNGARDIFVKDLATRAVTRITTGSDGSELSVGGDLVPIFSHDGTQIAFVDGNSGLVYVKNLVTGALIAVAPVTAPLLNQKVAFSVDDHELIFVSDDGTLVPGDTNNARDVFKVRIAQSTTGFVQDKADQPSASTSGALPFTDPDVGDTHTVTVKPKDGAVGTLTAKVAAEPGDKAGSIAWTYTVDHKAVASLSGDQHKVETFTVTVDDGHGGTAEQVVTITIRGAATPASSSVPSGSTAATAATPVPTDTVSTASLGSTEHAGMDTAHTLDTHHGHGLTGFEL